MITLKVHFAQAVTTLHAEAGENLLAVLARNEITVYAPCKGSGKCKKCRVKIKTGETVQEVLSCQTAVTQDAEVWAPEIAGGGLTEFETAAWPQGLCGIGAAVDIGTTTVAATLIDLSNGASLDRLATLNPQHVCGSDVISRITACGEGKLELQKTLIRRTIAEMLEKLCKKHGVERLKVVTVCGNTTMAHLFCGVDPTPIGVFPFTPAFTATQTLSGSALGIAAPVVYMLPSAAGYIGSDIVCGIAARQMDHGDPCLLADLGTNGELALYDGNRLFAASTAAGPALEGANIECGIGGIGGAICAAALEEGELRLRTIDDLPPIGICGSGLVDLIALLVATGIIDETGAFDEECAHPLAGRLEDGRFMLTDQIYLSQKDVRQYQLAKAAISAGILTLCDYAKIKPADIPTLCIAGGLGFYLSVESAMRTGLIPPEFAGKIRVIGNSGLAGAVRCLIADERERAQRIADEIEICELNNCDGFSDRFVDGMSFE